ncbi:MAG: hypothetical protein N3G19_00070 [Candidatus Pacearchaeota archaeon]|nr:hypothetical protein [Candidatus Pacearchaeota archaeon]
MDLEKVKKQRNHRKIVKMTIRTTPMISKWMKENDISPQLVFDEAIKELKSKADKKEKKQNARY